MSAVALLLNSFALVDAALSRLEAFSVFDERSEASPADSSSNLNTAQLNRSRAAAAAAMGHWQREEFSSLTALEAATGVGLGAAAAGDEGHRRSENSLDAAVQHLRSVLRILRPALLTPLAAPARAADSAAAVRSGTVTLDDEGAVRLNSDFIDASLQLAEKLSLNELLCVRLLRSARDLASVRLPSITTSALLVAAETLYYERRRALLCSLLALLKARSASPSIAARRLLSTFFDALLGEQPTSLTQSLRSSLSESLQRANETRREMKQSESYITLKSLFDYRSKEQSLLAECMFHIYYQCAIPREEALPLLKLCREAISATSTAFVKCNNSGNSRAPVVSTQVTGSQAQQKDGAAATEELFTDLVASLHHCTSILVVTVAATMTRSHSLVDAQSGSMLAHGNERLLLDAAFLDRVEKELEISPAAPSDKPASSPSSESLSLHNESIAQFDPALGCFSEGAWVALLQLFWASFIRDPSADEFAEDAGFDPSDEHGGQEPRPTVAYDRVQHAFRSAISGACFAAARRLVCSRRFRAALGSRRLYIGVLDEVLMSTLGHLAYVNFIDCAPRPAPAGHFRELLDFVGALYADSPGLATKFWLSNNDQDRQLLDAMEENSNGIPSLAASAQAPGGASRRSLTWPAASFFGGGNSAHSSAAATAAAAATVSTVAAANMPALAAHQRALLAAIRLSVANAFFANRFVRFAGDNLTIELFTPFIRMLSTLATGPVNAPAAFSFLSTYTGHRWVSLDHFFTVLRKTLEDFVRDATDMTGATSHASSSYLHSQSALSSPYPNTSHQYTHNQYLPQHHHHSASTQPVSSSSLHARKLRPADASALKATLHLLRSTMLFGEQNRSFASNRPSWRAPTTMVALLACPLSADVKAALCTSLSAFAQSSSEAARIWQCLMACQILSSSSDSKQSSVLPKHDTFSRGLQSSSSSDKHVNAQMGGSTSTVTLSPHSSSLRDIRWELDNAEAPSARYPFALSFLNLISKLLRFGVPTDASRLAETSSNDSSGNYSVAHSPVSSASAAAGDATAEVAATILGGGNQMDLVLGPRAPFMSFLRFVVDSVFMRLHHRQYANPQEQWLLAETSLRIMLTLLDREQFLLPETIGTNANHTQDEFGGRRETVGTEEKKSEAQRLADLQAKAATRLSTQPAFLLMQALLADGSSGSTGTLLGQIGELWARADTTRAEWSARQTTDAKFRPVDPPKPSTSAPDATDGADPLDGDDFQRQQIISQGALARATALSLRLMEVVQMREEAFLAASRTAQCTAPVASLGRLLKARRGVFLLRIAALVSAQAAGVREEASFASTLGTDGPEYSGFDDASGIGALSVIPLLAARILLRLPAETCGALMHVLSESGTQAKAVAAFASLLEATELTVVSAAAALRLGAHLADLDEYDLQRERAELTVLARSTASTTDTRVDASTRSADEDLNTTSTLVMPSVASLRLSPLDDCRLVVLELLRSQLRLGAPNLAHLLLGFNVRAPLSSSRLHAPAAAGCLHALLRLLNRDQIALSAPRVAARGSDLVLSLCSHPRTSSPTLAFLRSPDQDYFRRQLRTLLGAESLTPPSSVHSEFWLLYRSSLLRNLALELHISVRAGQRLHARALLAFIMGVRTAAASNGGSSLSSRKHTDLYDYAASVDDNDIFAQTFGYASSNGPMSTELPPVPRSASATASSSSALSDESPAPLLTLLESIVSCTPPSVQKSLPKSVYGVDTSALLGSVLRASSGTAAGRRRYDIGALHAFLLMRHRASFQESVASSSSSGTQFLAMDVDGLSGHLPSLSSSASSLRALSGSKLSFEARQVLRHAMSVNDAAGRAAAQCAAAEGWHQLAAAAVISAFEELDALGSMNTVWTALERAASAISAVRTPTALAEVLSSSLVLLMAKLREELSARISQMKESSSLAASGINGTSTLLNGPALNVAAGSGGRSLLSSLPKETLHSLLRNVLAGVRRSDATSLLRGNMYASLLHYLAMTEAAASIGSNVDGNLSATVMHLCERDTHALASARSQLLQATANDAAIVSSSSARSMAPAAEASESDAGADVWRALALSTAGRIVDVHHDGSLLLERSGHLAAFVDELAQLGGSARANRGGGGGSGSGTRSAPSHSESASTLGPLYADEAKLCLLMRVARAPRGAAQLVQLGLLQRLADCHSIDYRPSALATSAAGGSNGVGSNSEWWTPSAHETADRRLLPVLRLVVAVLTALPGDEVAAADAALFARAHEPLLASLLRARPRISASSITSSESSSMHRSATMGSAQDSSSAAPAAILAGAIEATALFALLARHRLVAVQRLGENPWARFSARMLSALAYYADRPRWLRAAGAPVSLSSAIVGGRSSEAGSAGSRFSADEALWPLDARVARLQLNLLTFAQRLMGEGGTASVADIGKFDKLQLSYKKWLLWPDMRLAHSSVGSNWSSASLSSAQDSGAFANDDLVAGSVLIDSMSPLPAPPALRVLVHMLWSSCDARSTAAERRSRAILQLSTLHSLGQVDLLRLLAEHRRSLENSRTVVDAGRGSSVGGGDDPALNDCYALFAEDAYNGETATAASLALSVLSDHEWREKTQVDSVSPSALRRAAAVALRASARAAQSRLETQTQLMASSLLLLWRHLHFFLTLAPRQVDATGELAVHAAAALAARGETAEPEPFDRAALSQLQQQARVALLQAPVGRGASLLSALQLQCTDSKFFTNEKVDPRKIEDDSKFILALVNNIQSIKELH